MNSTRLGGCQGTTRRAPPLHHIASRHTASTSYGPPRWQRVGSDTLDDASAADPQPTSIGRDEYQSSPEKTQTHCGRAGVASRLRPSTYPLPCRRRPLLKQPRPLKIRQKRAFASGDDEPLPSLTDVARNKCVSQQTDSSTTTRPLQSLRPTFIGSYVPTNSGIH